MSFPAEDFRTGSSSKSPQFTRIITSCRTDRPDRFGSATYCAGEKGRRPEVQLEEPEQEQLLEQEQQRPELQPEQRGDRMSRLHSLRCSHHSFRPQSRSHKLPELLQPDDEHHGRSQPVHRSEQTQRPGCSCSCCCGLRHPVRQRLRGVPARPCRSGHTRKR